MTALARWAAITGFSLFVSVSFVMYAFAFEAVGSVPTTLRVDAYLRYGVRLATNPYFLAGLGLALAGAAIRMVLFSYVGIARTAIVSELTLVMSVVLAVLIFDSSLGRRELGGMALIMAGVYLVESATHTGP